MTLGYRGTADFASLSYYEQQMNCYSLDSVSKLIARKGEETSNFENRFIGAPRIAVHCMASRMESIRCRSSTRRDVYRMALRFSDVYLTMVCLDRLELH